MSELTLACDASMSDCRIGIHDYDWHVFGPGRDEFTWDYHTFDPSEEKLWTPGARYRKVTYPVGMENWCKPEFDARAAGRKAGKAPFGQLGEKLVTVEEDNKSVVKKLGCIYNFCRCNESMNTLWEKEVLIMRAKVKFPKFKEGNRYRLGAGGQDSALVR